MQDQEQEAHLSESEGLYDEKDLMEEHGVVDESPRKAPSLTDEIAKLFNSYGPGPIINELVKLIMS